jgi:hypothetical protein
MAGTSSAHLLASERDSAAARQAAPADDLQLRVFTNCL